MSNSFINGWVVTLLSLWEAYERMVVLPQTIIQVVLFLLELGDEVVCLIRRFVQGQEGILHASQALL